MRYISVDPATKSIAFLITDYNKTPIDIENLDTLINIDIVDTITRDLAPGVRNDSLDEMDRIDLLLNFLDKNIKEFITDDTTLLIERQISGTKTYIMYVALCTYFIMSKVKVKYIHPTKKNTLTIGGFKPDYRKYPDSYRANKEHTRSMFLHCKDFFKNKDKIKYDKKYERDLSDCFIQLIYQIIGQPSSIYYK